MRTLDARGEYFDHRTGEIWDLFFPGYHRTTDPGFETQVGSRQVGREFASDWFFSARDFDLFRGDFEKRSDARWTYSGGTDLVLVGAWIPEDGEPTVDWASTLSGSLGDEGPATLAIGHVIERLTRDLETGAEDPAYGVGGLTESAAPTGDRALRQVMIGALGGLAAALGKKGLGL